MFLDGHNMLDSSFSKVLNSMSFLFRKMNSSYATRRCFIVSIMTVFLFVIETRCQDTNMCHQMCREEKTYCDRDCTHFLFNIEAKTCEVQCDNDMASCFDRCNNMVKLEHVISEHTSKDTTKDRQENIETVSSDLVDVNIDRLSSEKIRPPSSIVPLETTDADTNLVVRTDESSSCVQDCVSKEVDCELQCFIDLTKSMDMDNDCSSMCKRNKNICLETCSPLHYTVQREPKDIVAASPNRITSLGMTVQSSSLDNPDTDMSILRRILMGLPAEGTQIIGNWRL